MTQGSAVALHVLKVQGLLSFGDEVVFEFGRLNILVGPNGSGKSNLIDCLRIFKNCPLDVQETFKDAGFEEWLFRSGSDDSPASIEVHLELPKVSSHMRHRLQLGPPLRSLAQIEETIEEVEALSDYAQPIIFFQSQHGRASVTYQDSDIDWRVQRSLAEDEYHPHQSIVAQLRDVQRYPEITRLAELYSNWRVYSEWSFGRKSYLRESTPTDRADTYLSEAMDNLALVLNGLQGTSAHDKIQALLRDVKDSYRDYFTRIIFGRVGLELKEAPFDRPLPAKRLSDGTLRFLALAAILLHPKPPPLICLEEPELGMHPDMIRLVANMIIEASQRTQLIVTTHSEHLLTALEDDFDALFSFDTGLNGSFVRRLGRDGFQEWKDEHRLGELWTSGEIGGNRW